jgi:hypothetical protein
VGYIIHTGGMRNYKKSWRENLRGRENLEDVGEIRG